MKTGPGQYAHTLLQTCAARRGSPPVCSRWKDQRGSLGVFGGGEGGVIGRTLAPSGSRCERGAVAIATCLPGVARGLSQLGVLGDREEGAGHTSNIPTSRPRAAIFIERQVLNVWEKGTSRVARGSCIKQKGDRYICALQWFSALLPGVCLIYLCLRKKDAS